MNEAFRLDYELGPEIGRGRFGTVHRCTSRLTGQAFAVKSIDKSLLTDPVDLELIENEAKLTRLASAGNPDTVVQIHAAYEDTTTVRLVLDLCPGPDLLTLLISRRAPLPEPEAAAIAQGLMESIAAIHRRGVAHRDVKPDNVLFDGEGRVRLADFGSAGCPPAMSGLVGTPHYVAPEVVRGDEEGYGEKVDVWSAGVVVYVMLGGVLPFAGESAAEVFEAVLRGNLRFPTRLFGWVSPAAKELMRRMMCRDVSRRFSADQVLRHPWITSGGGTRLVDS